MSFFIGALTHTNKNNTHEDGQTRSQAETFRCTKAFHIQPVGPDPSPAKFFVLTLRGDYLRSDLELPLSQSDPGWAEYPKCVNTNKASIKNQQQLQTNRYRLDTKKHELENRFLMTCLEKCVFS